MYLRCAAEQFGDKEPSEIEHIIKETLEGHQRETMAHMTVEEIYRKVFINIRSQLKTTEIILFNSFCI